MHTDQDTAQVVLAMDIGGSYIKSAVFSGEALRRELPLVPSCADGGLEDIASALRAAVEAAGPVDGMGIAIPGPFDYRRGVSWMTHKFAALRGRALSDFLPDIPACFLHDANAFLLGERQAGAARGFRRVGGVTLGTGIGAAALFDEVLQVDEWGAPTTEVTLWKRPFRHATVEKVLFPEGASPLRDLAERARSGDGAAVDKWREFGELLAEVLTAWCDRLELEAIVVGGQVAGSLDLFREALSGLPIHETVLCGHAALLGAAANFQGRR